VAAAGGTAGIYGLRLGDVLLRPRLAHWFAKPDGLSYKEVFSRLAPIVRQSGGALWTRQMTLGPAREFCLHTEEALAFPPPFSPQTLALRPVWPEE
jgi:hypothetical protein